MYRERILYWDTAIGIQDIGRLPLRVVMGESGDRNASGRMPRAEQGLPPTIEDPITLNQIAAVFHLVEESEASAW